MFLMLLAMAFGSGCSQDVGEFATESEAEVFARILEHRAIEAEVVSLRGGTAFQIAVPSADGARAEALLKAYPEVPVRASKPTIVDNLDSAHERHRWDTERRFEAQLRDHRSIEYAKVTTQWTRGSTLRPPRLASMHAHVFAHPDVEEPSALLAARQHLETATGLGVDQIGVSAQKVVGSSPAMVAVGPWVVSAESAASLRVTMVFIGVLLFGLTLLTAFLARRIRARPR